LIVRFSADQYTRPTTKIQKNKQNAKHTLFQSQIIQSLSQNGFDPTDGDGYHGLVLYNDRLGTILEVAQTVLVEQFTKIEFTYACGRLRQTTAEAILVWP